MFPQTMYEWSTFLYFSSTWCCHYFFSHSDMEWYFIMLICIYPMTNNVEIFSHAYSSSVTSLHWNVCSCLLPILPTGFILYFTTSFNTFFFYIFYILVIFKIHDVQTFFLSQWLVFSSSQQCLLQSKILTFWWIQYCIE